MHEEPLHLIPHELREDVRKEFGLYIEGDLCPACRQMLREQYGGRMEDVPVQRIAFSEKNRIGIGTFTPSDPKSQDISELTGSVEQVTPLLDRTLEPPVGPHGNLPQHPPHHSLPARQLKQL